MGAILLLILPYSIIWVYEIRFAFPNIKNTRDIGFVGLLFWVVGYSGGWILFPAILQLFFGSPEPLFGFFIMLLIWETIKEADNHPDSNVAAYLMMLCGVLLLIMRYSLLRSEGESFVYGKEYEDFTYHYVEIPIGFVLALTFEVSDIVWRWRNSTKIDKFNL